METLYHSIGYDFGDVRSAQLVQMCLALTSVLTAAH